MACITISRQLGSLGCDVAFATAEKMGFKVVWRELINQAARRAGSPEAALATIDELGILGCRPSTAEREAYHTAIQQIMEELAQKGQVIIVGRAGQVILKDHPKVMHVRVIAPEAVRVTRLSERQGISSEAALAQVETSDRNRRNYLRRYYQVNWEDAQLYDLVINTANLTVAACADLICTTFSHYLQGHSSTNGTVPKIECE